MFISGIYAYGFEKPSAIQQRAIVPCVKGHDVIAQAQSGTGKTATFSISILQQVDTKLASCQALVLAPTRELAQQIQKVVMALGDYMGAQCHACIGGTSVREDMNKLNNGIHIVVGKLRFILSRAFIWTWIFWSIVKRFHVNSDILTYYQELSRRIVFSKIRVLFIGWTFGYMAMLQIVLFSSILFLTAILGVLCKTNTFLHFCC